jgi:hypothetical protein
VQAYNGYSGADCLAIHVQSVGVNLLYATVNAPSPNCLIQLPVLCRRPR